MAAYVQDTSFLSRRAVAFVLIVGMHVLLVYGLASGLARKAIEVIAPPIETQIVEELQTEDEPPPPPPPEFERPPVEVPPPEVAIQLPVEAQPTNTISNVTDRPVPMAPPPPPPPPRAVQKVPPRPGRNFPTAEEFYPAASRRLGEEGAVAVRACVGPNGRLVGEPTVQESSGSARLDEGAVKLAKAGRYQAGTEDGKPVQDCFVFRIKFELR